MAGPVSFRILKNDPSVVEVTAIDGSKWKVSIQIALQGLVQTDAKQATAPFAPVFSFTAALITNTEAVTK